MNTNTTRTHFGFSDLRIRNDGGQMRSAGLSATGCLCMCVHQRTQHASRNDERARACTQSTQKPFGRQHHDDVPSRCYFVYGLCMCPPSSYASVKLCLCGWRYVQNYLTCMAYTRTAHRTQPHTHTLITERRTLRPRYIECLRSQTSSTQTRRTRTQNIVCVCGLVAQAESNAGHHAHWSQSHTNYILAACFFLQF